MNKLKNMPKTIFLIEDDAFVVEVYKTALENSGYNVEVFTLGQDVIKYVEKAKTEDIKIPDLILLDIILPDIDGTQVLEKIRQNPKTENTPVFAFTNYSNSDLEKKCNDLKVKKFVIKTNCSPSNLIKLVKETL